MGSAIEVRARLVDAIERHTVGLSDVGDPRRAPGRRPGDAPMTAPHFGASVRARLTLDLLRAAGRSAIGALPYLPMYGLRGGAGAWHDGDAPRVAILTDTIDDINGVAIGLRRLTAAARRAGLPLRLVGGGAGHAVFADADDVVRLPTILSRALPFYPEMIWRVPHLPSLLRWLIDARIELVQCATPGPVGITALAAARLLGLPVIAQYHTEVAEFATRMTGDARLGGVMSAVVAWFYRRVDLCLAPSSAASARLTGYGITRERIARVPRGVDLSLFHPQRRDRGWLARYGLGDGPVILYVGRLSREKNFDALIEAYAHVRARRPDARLLIVGDGPHAAALAAPGVVLAGALTGDTLGAAYASADLFAFPSETEVFGNVVVEAQAAGLPVVVAAAGAAHEQIVPDVTGLVIDGGRPTALAAALIALLDDPARRDRMGRAGHRHAQRYDLDAAARGTFAVYRRFLGRAEPRPTLTRLAG